jgi:hypothetical protein
MHLCYGVPEFKIVKISQGKKGGDARTLSIPENIRKNQRAQREVFEEIGFLSNRISTFLQNKYKIQSGNIVQSNVDLSDTVFWNADFSQTDFSTFDISGADFYQVNLEGAKLTLTPEKFEDADFYHTNWWDAEAIAPPLLTYLIERSYPAPDPTGNLEYPKSLTKQYYVSQIQRLCKPWQPTCGETKIKYEEKQ